MLAMLLSVASFSDTQESTSLPSTSKSDMASSSTVGWESRLGIDLSLERFSQFKFDSNVF